MPRVFISYRRRESGGTAGRIRDRMIRAFGSRNVFVDVDKIRYGDDFQRAIDEAIRKSTVFVAVIGQGWNRPPEGSTQDYVYAEVETALRHKVPVIPVLVDEATIPSEGSLPPSISPIARLNFIEVKLPRFDADVTELIRSIDDRTATRRFLARIPPWAYFSVSLAAASLILTAVFQQQQSATTPSTPQAPLGPPMTKKVESDLIERVVVNPPIVRPGESMTVNVQTLSSDVQANAVFDHGNGMRSLVPAAYDRSRGGIFISYTVPVKAPAGKASLSVWVQQLKGRREDRVNLTFEVRPDDVSQARPEALRLDDLGLRQIPGGTLRMGSSKGQKDEQPVHRVTVSTFLLMDHEFTFGELTKLHAFDQTVLGRPLNGTLPDPDYILAEVASTWSTIPVAVKFSEAQRIAMALSAMLKQNIRLPTEPEWEYAARGGLVGKTFPWGDSGDTVNGVAVRSLVETALAGCTGFNTMPVRNVKSSVPNGYGLFDVAGNAWEWTDSAYKPYPYSTVPVEDLPKYPYRVIRGGGHSQESCRLEVSFRGLGDAIESAYGIRFAADLRQ